MNSYLEAQIKTMILYAENFENACKVGAMKDDGKIAPDEARQLRIIHSAVSQFQKRLRSAMK